MLAAQACSRGGTRDVPVVAIEQRRHVDSIEGVDELLLRLLVGDGRREPGELGADRERRARRRAEVEDQVLEGRRPRGRPAEGDRARERVAQLTYVARPRVPNELSQVRARDLVAGRKLALEHTC